MADKLRAQQQLEALQAKFVGVGSADTPKHEWLCNMHRDSATSYIGHPPLLQYLSIGLGQCREKTRVQMLERMIRPVGPPPPVS
jgi:splicing factor 3B subunit 5